MKPAARLQAAIEILDAVVGAARDGGPAADTIVERYFRARRYAGSGDRRAVRELVFRAIRFAGDRPPGGRAALLGLLEAEEPEALALFDGRPHAPAPLLPDEPRAAKGTAPAWLLPALRASLGAEAPCEIDALVGRAPLDLRVNRGKGITPDAVAAALPFPVAPVAGLPVALPMALRAAPGSPVEASPLFLDGTVEVQDAGSQAVAAIAAARPGERVVDLCAGAGGKTLALAADMEGAGRIIACDIDRGRLARLPLRAGRAGVLGMIEARLLDPGREWERLRDLEGSADLVLVDAPCSGSGTWRRNPELRWRLTARRLEALVAGQHRLLALAARLVRPGGGRLVYAVCSVLDAEGERQAEMVATHGPGLRHDRSLQLLPGRDGCDGFFVASFSGSC